MKRKTFEICKGGYVVATAHTWNAALLKMHAHMKETLKLASVTAAFERSTLATNKAPNSKDHVFGAFEWVSHTSDERHVYVIIMASYVAQ